MKKLSLKNNIHRGREIVRKGSYRIIDCEICGFKHVYPVPDEKGIARYYRSKYYTGIKNENTVCGISRLMKKNKETKNELRWLSATLYSDVNHVLEKYIDKPANILDVGCGTSDFLKFMKKANWNIVGIEPSLDMEKRERGLVVHNKSFEDFVAGHPEDEKRFNAIIMLNVLEHVPDPVRFLNHAKRLLYPRNGLVCIRVPNDFNILQDFSSKKCGKSLWWVAIPDHINYFDNSSLSRLLASSGFKVFHAMADFPMEFFILMGENYVDNPAAGKLCHRKRMNFELSIDRDLRWNIYRSMTKLGLGRDLLVFAKMTR